jgi:hypothetical protein
MIIITSSHEGSKYYDTIIIGKIHIHRKLKNIN